MVIRAIASTKQRRVLWNGRVGLAYFPDLPCGSCVRTAVWDTRNGLGVLAGCDDWRNLG